MRPASAFTPLAVALSLSLSVQFLLIVTVYLVTTLSYSVWLKHVVILDVLFLSSGFLWRVLGGAIAIEVPVSEWLFLCTVFVALFFGFNKRRAELLHHPAHAGIADGEGCEHAERRGHGPAAHSARRDRSRLGAPVLRLDVGETGGIEAGFAFVMHNRHYALVEAFCSGPPRGADRGSDMRPRA